MSHSRRKRTSRAPLWILAGLSICLAGIRWGSPIALPASQAREPDVLARGLKTAETVNLRPVFRHSVIAGGAYSAAEVEQAELNDPVVRAHYRVFRSSRLRMTKAPAARSAYVSYRVGDAIYWTRSPVSLPAGELLITDGEYEARARCGNRVASTPQRPVSPAEPVPSEFEIADPVPPEVGLPGTKLIGELFPAYLRGPDPVLVIPAATRSLPATAATEGSPVPVLMGSPSGGPSPFALNPPMTVSASASGGTVLGAPMDPNPWFPFVPAPPLPSTIQHPVLDPGSISPDPAVALPTAPVTVTLTQPSSLQSESTDVPEPGTTMMMVIAAGLVALASMRWATGSKGPRSNS